MANLSNLPTKTLTILKNRATSGIHELLMKISDIDHSKHVTVFNKISDSQPSLPSNINQIDESLKHLFYINNTFKNVKLYTLHNKYISYYGIIFKNFRLFTPSLVQSKWSAHIIDSMTTNILSFLSRQWSSRVIDINNSKNNPVAIIYEYWSSGNYYHWICDALPRLLLLKEQGLKCTIFIPEYNQDYTKQTISWLGFDNIVEIKYDKVYRVKHTVLTEITAGIGYQNGPLIRKVRDILISKYNDSLPAGKTTGVAHRIYSSRSSAKMRKIVNENDVIILLKKYDFCAIDFSQHSFLEQVELMSNATILIGAHGANLTNIMFMKNDSSVIELMNKECFNPCYYNLASNLNIQYNYLPCEAFGNNPDVNNDDILVDLALLERTLLHSISPAEHPKKSTSTIGRAPVQL